MTVLDHAQKRVDAVIEEVDRLKQSDFPYDHSRDALELLGEELVRLRNILKKVDPAGSSESILPHCITSLDALFNCVPLLGFILRSTNTRNAFEAYAPLLRLARKILGNATKLIISSEWDYSPYVYTHDGYLANFIMLGLPAPESANPLLLPLSGHELGHSTWKYNHISDTYEKRIERRILQEITDKRLTFHSVFYSEFPKEDFSNNMFVWQIRATIYAWAVSQCEEIFCDFFGLRLFAESYLYAFEYLLSPGFPGERSVSYPNMKCRVSYLEEASKAMKIEVKHKFTDSFTETDKPDDKKKELMVSTADAVSKSLVPELIILAQKIVDEKAIPRMDSQIISDISKEFEMVIPTSKNHSIVNILNAGWRCYLNPELWNDISQIKQEDKDRVLKDIMLKSMEVSEAYERLGVQPQ